MQSQPGAAAASVVRSFAAHTRLIAAGLALLWLIVAIGLYRGAEWATWIWPVPDADMTFNFLSSIAAAIAVPLGWLAIVNEPAAATGLALDAVGVGGVCAVALAVMGASGSAGNLFIYAAGLGFSALLGWVVFRFVSPLSIRDETPLPRAVRIMFILMVFVAMIAGGALMLRLDNVYPWDLPARTSTLVGAWLLGAGTSFAFGVLRNSWVHAGSTLAGFLAYDAVQFMPYLRTIRDRDATADMRQYATYSESAVASSAGVNSVSLGAYMSVILLSAVVAIYFFFIARETRIWRHLGLEPATSVGTADVSHV